MTCSFGPRQVIGRPKPCVPLLCKGDKRDQRTKEGYTLVDRTGERVTQIGSKGFADDTAALAGTQAGLGRIAEWVNEFCVVNRISMNDTKSLVFGRDEEENEMLEPIEIVKQGAVDGPVETHRIVQQDKATHTRIKVKPIKANDNLIKYLGVHMNMELNWKRQIAEMNRTVGHFVDLFRNCPCQLCPPCSQDFLRYLGHFHPILQVWFEVFVEHEHRHLRRQRVRFRQVSIVPYRSVHLRYLFFPI